jgi:hypothetical protein
MAKRTDLSQTGKHLAFRQMAKTYQSALTQGNHIGAHVIAFSYLEDRITAMDVVRCSVANLNRRAWVEFGRMVGRLQSAGDVPADLGKQLRDAAQERNRLFHAAMWNLTCFSAEAAADVFALARKADLARKAQKKRLGK